MSIRTISPQDLYRHITLGHNVLLLDVRTPDEYEEGHIIGAVTHPLESLDPESSIQKVRIAYPTLPTIYIVCDSGSKAIEACQQLADAGYDYLVAVEGGTQAWIMAGLPTERKNGSMQPFQQVENDQNLKIDQQVQIAVGAVVALGTLLGTFVNTGFLAITLLAGAGYAYEGIFGTDYVKQALMKMSWNKEA
jgi:rhodanese-related sulfurtransferase